jgi:hypothetical protein
MRVVFARQILQSYVSKESLVEAQNRMQTTCCRATRRGSVQGPARQGGLPNLLSTNAGKIVILYLTSSSDNIVCTNNEYAIAHAELANNVHTEHYYECCGKSICRGCVFSFATTGLLGQCPYCNADRKGKTDEEKVGEMMKRVEANDASSVCELGGYFNHGLGGLEQDCVKAMELYAWAAKLGSSFHPDQTGGRREISGTAQLSNGFCFHLTRS